MNRRSVTAPASIVALVAWLAFAALTVIMVRDHGAPPRPDHGLLSWSVSHRPPVAVAVARGLTATGTAVVPYTLVVLAGLVAGRTARQRTAAVLLGVVCLGAGQAVRYGVMDLIHRARPPRGDWQTQASGWSYPSGHSTTAALTAGLLVLALWARSPRGRAALCLLATCWGAGVGLTRVFLGVHWFTDVVGGWLFAVGWLGVLLAVAARWLPARFQPGAFDAGGAGSAGATGPAGGPTKAEAARDPDRGGRPHVA